MKKATVTVSFDDEKLDALVYFMKKDSTDPQKALQNELEKLYEKYIPVEMREYLESKAPAQTRERAKRPARPTPQKPKQEQLNEAEADAPGTGGLIDERT